MSRAQALKGAYKYPRRQTNLWPVSGEHLPSIYPIASMSGSYSVRFLLP